MAKRRYKVRKEQLEKVVESFVMEAAAPEAKKHVKGSLGDNMVEKTEKVSEKDPDDTLSQAPEAKKHVKGSESGKMVEKSPNAKAPGNMTHKMKHAPEAKKHVKGSVSESVLNENIISDLRKVPGLIKQAVATLRGEVESGNIDVEELKSDFSKNLSKVKSSDVNESLESLTNLLTESDKILVESKLGKLVGNALKGLGFAGLAAGIPGMMSQIMGYTDWQWTTKLHIALEPFCSSLPSWFGCGAFMFLVIALSIGSILGGVAKSFKHRD